MNRTVIDDVIHPKVAALLARGVVVHRPSTVHADDDLDPERFAPGVVIHAGCRLSGSSTSMGPGCVIGEETPTTVVDCCLGHGVALKGGSFVGSTFLDGSEVGSAAHVRPGTLLEEHASAAHCVGFKQTILLPFVTVGSLANFCDCLMAGGTGPRDHGEVGSSYIHFNFTPNQDKATASLLGDVPQGVMLDRPPIFLGGQGGLVGPARLAYGTVVAAGVVCRQDILEEGMLYTGRPGNPDGGRPRKYRTGVYVGVERVFRNNLLYIGNIRALHAWYEAARRPLAAGDRYREACCESAIAGLRLVLDERLHRLGQVAEALEARSAKASGVVRSDEVAEGEQVAGGLDLSNYERAIEAHRCLKEAWPGLCDASAAAGTGTGVGADERERFLEGWSDIDPLTPYQDAVSSLGEPVKQAGRAWLQALVDEVVGFLPGGSGRDKGGRRSP